MNDLIRWRQSLVIFEKYNSNWLGAADHDQIYSSFDAETIPKNSKDGKALKKLGWQIESEGEVWSICVEIQT